MAKKPAPDQKRVQIGVKLPPDVFDLIDANRASYPVPVTRTWVIERAIRYYCQACRNLAENQKAKRK